MVFTLLVLPLYLYPLKVVDSLLSVAMFMLEVDLQQLKIPFLTGAVADRELLLAGTAVLRSAVVVVMVTLVMTTLAQLYREDKVLLLILPRLSAILMVPLWLSLRQLLPQAVAVLRVWAAVCNLIAAGAVGLLLMV